MYQLGSTVVYGSHDVCKVVGTEKRRIDKKIVEYLVIEPVDGASCRYFIPLRNEAAMSKLRPLITRAELDGMLSIDALRQNVWVEDEDRRRARYKELISANDIPALISMVYYLHLHKQHQLDSGRKFHQSDENFLRDAEKLLESELSLVLGIPVHEVGDYLKTIFT